MSGYKNFAVIGAGNIGALLIDELLKLKESGTISSVTVITRSDVKSKYPEWVSKGVKSVIIDYDSEATFRPAFEGVDVVISTVNPALTTKQQEFAVAAKAGGAKLFLPSEFGLPTDQVTEGVFLEKRRVQEKLREIDLPYALIYNGLWIDFVFTPLFLWDFENGKVDIVGKGDTPVTLTYRHDVVRFLLHALIHFPRSKLEWKIFNLEGERISLNEAAARYQAKTGKKLQITYTPISTIEERIAKNPNDFISYLRLIWEQGEGVVGEPTDAWPEWNPKSVLEVIAP